MKNVVSLSLLLFTIVSCSQLEELDLFGKNKDNEHEAPPCPTVTNDSIPETVANTFANEYPDVTPELWCVTDSNDYVAVFLMDSLETKAFIASDGVFIKEEVDIDQQGNHEDEDTGCECEFPGHDQEDHD